VFSQHLMATDRHNLLQSLKFELESLDKGDSHRADGPNSSPAPFQNSVMCITRVSTGGRRCGECLLIEFVPPLFRKEPVPCHHIPLNAFGETVYTLQRVATGQELEETLRTWLQQTIRLLEAEARPAS